MRIVPIFPWLRTGALCVPFRSQTIFATDNLRTSGRRYDGVHYVLDNIHYDGIVHGIFQYGNHRDSPRLCLIRRLCETDPSIDNSLFVNEFGHKSLRYALRHGNHNDCIIAVVFQSELYHLQPLFRDQHEVVTRYGFQTPVNDIEDSREDRLEAHFSS